jgi:transcriptional regulator with XRE-family HTH domain
MTITTEGRLRITRPGAGVAIDPGRLMAMRHRRLVSRQQMSARVAALGLVSEHGEPVTTGRDAIGKYETGARKPSLDALRAICAVLDCKPDDLMPGGPAIPLPPSAKARQARLDHNRDLREFALAYGLRYKNGKTGRVYYGRKLRAAYARHVDLLAAISARDDGAIQEARAALAAALAAAPRAPAQTGDDGKRLAS